MSSSDQLLPDSGAADRHSTRGARSTAHSDEANSDRWLLCIIAISSRYKSI